MRLLKLDLLIAHPAKDCSLMFDKSQVLTVKEFNAAAKQVIESSLPLLWVRGEISNFMCAASGHWYFSLKDTQAQVRCVMFRHKSQYLDFKAANGLQVEVLALPTLYEARGEFQLTLERMRPAGQGALFEAFEQLKEKLQKEGLFDPERKRELPFLPKQIGVVTSPQAAALRDVLRTLSNRLRGVPVVLYPTLVQGEGAAAKIAAAIQIANQRAECDVLIVCRGGGSIEDLWSFNEEVVARAIATSRIPVVSGVGHETDFTIADFVADLRAATPTAAAQAVLPDGAELQQRFAQSEQRLARAALRFFEQKMQQLDFLQRRLLHPAQGLEQQKLRLFELHRRLQAAHLYQTQRWQWRWTTLNQRVYAARPNFLQFQLRSAETARRLREAFQRNLESRDGHLARLQDNLQLLDPTQVLSRGYSLVRDANGKVVTDGKRLALGDNLQITFAHGQVAAAVTSQEIN